MKAWLAVMVTSTGSARGRLEITPVRTNCVNDCRRHTAARLQLAAGGHEPHKTPPKGASSVESQRPL